MKKFTFGCFALVCAVLLTVSANAGTVRLTGSGVGDQAPGTTSGTFNVVIDLNTLDTFQNGGITFTIQNDGIISFTDATILNPGGRWTIAADATTPGSVLFNASSVLTPAFPAGSQNQVFATVTWSAPAGAAGVSNLTYLVEAEAMFDGRDFGTDVTDQYTFETNFVAFVPEPGSLTMAGLSLIGLAMRRRIG